jgi:hypothetical protein
MLMFSTKTQSLKDTMTGKKVWEKGTDVRKHILNYYAPKWMRILSDHGGEFPSGKTVHDVLAEILDLEFARCQEKRMEEKAKRDLPSVKKEDAPPEYEYTAGLEGDTPEIEETEEKSGLYEPELGGEPESDEPVSESKSDLELVNELESDQELGEAQEEAHDGATENCAEDIKEVRSDCLIYIYVCVLMCR